MFKVYDKNTRTSLTSFLCFIVIFEHISHLFLVFPLLTFNKQMLSGSMKTVFFAHLADIDLFKVNSENIKTMCEICSMRSVTSLWCFHNLLWADFTHWCGVSRLVPVNIAKFSRTPILKNICERLLLKQDDIWDNFMNWGSFEAVLIEKRFLRYYFLKQPSIGVLKICSKLTGKHPYQSAISMKLHRRFIEIALRHGCFPGNLLHFFRTLFPKKTSGGLLL